MGPSVCHLATLAYCDFGAVVRGRSMPSAELDQHPQASVGWVPSAIARPPFGPSVKPNPFGPIGDLRLLPDHSTRIVLPSDGRASTLDLVLCDLVEVDGTPWDCCPRTFLRAAVDEIEHELGARARVSFEHEFQLLLDAPLPPPMSLEAQRLVDPFPERVMGALCAAGLTPERFLPEGGPHQYEIPLTPTGGVEAADRSVLLQAIVREMARRHGTRASFSPLVAPDDTGNGAHVHISLHGADGAALFYDAERPAGLSVLGGRFAAGVLAHAGALSALTAASPVSKARLRPNLRSVGAVCLGERNREALLRIPPLVTIAQADPGRQMRLEYRGADATANPYLALAVLLHAGLSGIRKGLPPPPVLARDPLTLEEAERRDLGVVALPTTLDASLRALAGDATARGWLPSRLYDIYAAIKQAEIDAAAEQSLPELCRRYAALY
jgi:glutamine synthetase